MLERMAMFLFSIYWRRLESNRRNYRVCKMIQDTCRFEDGIARLRDNPEAVFDEYGLTEEERRAFRSDPPFSMPLMGKIGLHPLLRLHYGLATSDKIVSDMSIRRYPDLLESD